MSDILSNIVANKRQEVAAARAALPERELRSRLADAPPPRNFTAALKQPGKVALIAEFKRASPSVGLIRTAADPVDVATTYQQHGAAAISVLTDQKFFQGTLADLTRVRAATRIPVLRKDFILDTYQLLEARAAGADAVLLIAECLDDCMLRKLHNEALELGLHPLVELYEPENLPRVLDAGAAIIGINNRNLRTFQTDLDHVIRLRADVPQECILVAESGIRTASDVARLRAARIDAMLVGESLMQAADIGAAVAELLG